MKLDGLKFGADTLYCGPCQPRRDVAEAIAAGDAFFSVFHYGGHVGSFPTFEGAENEAVRQGIADHYTTEIHLTHRGWGYPECRVRRVDPMRSVAIAWMKAIDKANGGCWDGKIRA